MSADASQRVRRGRPNARYTAIANQLIDHPTLSVEARLVLIYLLSKPEDWELMPGDIRRLLGTGDARCGRNKTYEVIKELKDSGYVRSVKETDHYGHFEGVTYYVYDEPVPIEGDGSLEEASTPSLATSRKLRGEASTPRPEKRDTAPAPRPGFRDPGKRDLTKDRKEQMTELPPPSPQTSTEAGGSGFKALWRQWPEEAKPRHEGAAQRFFEALSAQDQHQAVAFAGVHCRMLTQDKRTPLMIDFIRLKQFRDYVGGPTITSDAFFCITPAHREWDTWMRDLRSRFSSASCEYQERLGFLLVRSRWPISSKSAGGRPELGSGTPKPPSAQSQSQLAAATAYQ